MLMIVFRYSYKETFGKWRTGDLLLGLAYLARRETENAHTSMPGNVVTTQAATQQEALQRLVRAAAIRTSYYQAYV
jgi:hypothetical protein